MRRSVRLETAGHVAVRQWMLSLPIPPRLPLAAQPDLVNAGAAGGAARADAPSAGAGRTGRRQRPWQCRHAESSASGPRQPQRAPAAWCWTVYTDAVPMVRPRLSRRQPRTSTCRALQTATTRLMKLLTRRGVLVEQMGQTNLAEQDTDGDEARTLRRLQIHAVSGPEAGGAGQGAGAPTRGRSASLTGPGPGSASMEGDRIFLCASYESPITMIAGWPSAANGLLPVVVAAAHVTACPAGAATSTIARKADYQRDRAGSLMMISWSVRRPPAAGSPGATA